MSESEYTEECEEQDERDQKQIQLLQQQKKVVAEKQKIYKKFRVKVYLGMCKYPVVHKVCEQFNWKETNVEDDWNLFWYDWSVNPDRYSQMKLYQKINHFPGMEQITRKDNLAKNLNIARKMFPDDFSFYPQTFWLPLDLMQFIAFTEKMPKKTIYIAKPVAGCQGRGIRLFKNYQNSDLVDPQVVQEYQASPYLINGYKFDLRIYVVVVQVVPQLQLLFYHDGMARFCTTQYQDPSKNLKNVYMHLTNYAINKKNDNFDFNADAATDAQGSKWGLQAVFEQMRKDGCDMDVFMPKLYDLCIKAVICILPQLQFSYQSFRVLNPRFADGDPMASREPYWGSNCFEVLGYDVMILSDFTPILLEVNHSPSFTCDTPLDLRIKQTLIQNVIEMFDIQQDDKILYQKVERANLIKTIYGGKAPPKITKQPAPTAKSGSKKSKKQKSEETKEKKGIQCTKKMPTYASVQQHIQKCLETMPFTQIYPLPAGVPDRYQEIYNGLRFQDQIGRPTLKTRMGNESEPRNQLSVPQLPQVLQPIEVDDPLIEPLPVTQRDVPEVERFERPPLFEKQASPQRELQREPPKYGTRVNHYQQLIQDRADQVPARRQIVSQYAQVPPPARPQSEQSTSERVDPIAEYQRRQDLEWEFGNQRGIQFRGVERLTELRQGQARNDKADRTTEIELQNKLRAMLRYGVKEQVEAAIRIG